MTYDEYMGECCQTPRSPSDDPRWDYRKCKCENNGDYCDYCLSLIEPPEED